MIIRNIADVKKLKPGQPCEIILDRDDGSPDTYLKIQEEYEAVAKAVAEVHSSGV